MRTRVGQLIGEAVEGMPWLGTFHSIAARMLRRHAELVGLQSNYTIIDTDDQLRLLKQLIQAEGIDEKRWPARQLAVSDRPLEEPRSQPRRSRCRRERGLCQRQGASRSTGSTRTRLKALNACDFGDLLLHMLNIFRQHRDVLELYQQRFKYILVDEYQDTNRSSTCGCGCSRRSARTSAWSVTTTSRSIHGVAQKSPISCGSKRIFRAPK